jgi:hypothetical protein
MVERICFTDSLFLAQARGAGESQRKLTMLVTAQAIGGWGHQVLPKALFQNELIQGTLGYMVDVLIITPVLDVAIWPNRIDLHCLFGLAQCQNQQDLVAIWDAKGFGQFALVDGGNHTSS